MWFWNIIGICFSAIAIVVTFFIVVTVICVLIYKTN